MLPFRGGKHREVQDLLPWYLAGRLDADEQERVDAHLSVCADCQEEVRFQRRLGSEIAELPLDVEQSWSLMRQRIVEQAPERTARARWRWSPPTWLGGGAIAGAGAVAWRNSVPLSGGMLAGALLAIGLVWMGPLGQADRYHALSAGPVASAGNVMVIFRPETP